jgi:hypothetical protein
MEKVYREDVNDPASNATAAIRYVLVGHGLRFAAEFPDTPRAVLEPRTRLDRP